MTTELEKEFFKVFEIEPKYQDACIVEDKYWQNEELANKYGTFDMYMNAKCGNQENCTTQCSCAYTKEIYPEITDRKLLEMICIYNSTYTNGYANYSLLNERNVEKLKEQILKNCLIVRDDIKHQIQQLFKGEE